MKYKLIFTIILLFLSIISVPHVSAETSIFQRDVVDIKDLENNPRIYDSTTAYRKISVIADINELERYSASIGSDEYFLLLDVTYLDILEGFSKGDRVMATGSFKHVPLGKDIFNQEYVMHYPKRELGEVAISDVKNNPAAYNGKFIKVVGNLTNIRDSSGKTIMYIEDVETEKSIKVLFYGVTTLEKGMKVQAEGLLNGDSLHSENVGQYRDSLPFNVLTGFEYVTTFLAVILMTLFLALKKKRK